jgi:hypothetical protein
MRKWSAIMLNLIAPGTGLILLRREWLGVLLALVFTMLCLVGLWGWLLIPLVIPTWLMVSTLAGAGLLWLWSQGLLYRRLRVIAMPGIESELRDLCRRAADAVDRQDFQSAEQILVVARSLNDEDVEVNVHWAELMTRLGRFRQARRTWHRVLRLDRSPTRRREAVQALEKLPDA